MQDRSGSPQGCILPMLSDCELLCLLGQGMTTEHWAREKLGGCLKNLRYRPDGYMRDKV
jgi:hypothetical protein